MLTCAKLFFSVISWISYRKVKRSQLYNNCHEQCDNGGDEIIIKARRLQGFFNSLLVAPPAHEAEEAAVNTESLSVSLTTTSEQAKSGRVGGNERGSLVKITSSCSRKTNVAAASL